MKHEVSHLGTEMKYRLGKLGLRQIKQVVHREHCYSLPSPKCQSLTDVSETDGGGRITHPQPPVRSGAV